MSGRGREEWKRIIEELEKSGLQHKEFAAQKDLALGTLQFWLYKFRRESRQESLPAILPVEVVGLAAPSARQPVARGEPPGVLEAALPSGVVLRIPVGAEVSYVRQLLSALA